MIEVVEAQLVPPLGDALRPYRRLRRQRAGSDYAASEGAVQPDDVRADLPAAATMVDVAARVLPELTVFVRGAHGT